VREADRVTASEMTGYVLLFLAAVVAIWQTRRVAQANPTSRLPVFGTPPAVPPRSRLASGLAAGLGAFALSLVAAHGGHEGFAVWRFVVAVLLFAAVVACPAVVHNRRVPR